MKWTILACAAFLTLAQCMVVAAEPVKVKHVAGLDENDTRYEYPLKVLTLALEKTRATDGDYELEPVGGMVVSRLQKGLEDGRFHVGWYPPTEGSDKAAIPIPIPLRKGLLGFRIFIINESDKAKFAAVKTFEDVAQFQAGQGHDWPDTEILRSNGITVVAAPNYNGLFKMLVRGRFDYFPRGVHEPWDEVAARKDELPELFIEETICVQYPLVDFFWVNKDFPELADRIERGLRLAIEDGSFDKLFLDEYGDLLKRANLKDRKLFRINNPLLPKWVPVDDKSLFYDPQS